MIIRFTSEDRNVSLSARSSALRQGLTEWCSVSIAHIGEDGDCEK